MPFDQGPDDGTAAPGGNPASISYDFLGYDGLTDVYRGSDGQLYQGDQNGPNGFSPYTGTATEFSQTPGQTGPDRATATPPETPTGAPPPGPSGGGGGGGGATTPQQPSGPAPEFHPPGYTPPPPFEYGDFVAPSPEDLNSDPQYQYTLKTQQDALQKSAAARGVLNTGGTINDLLMNAKDIASTGYHDLWSRKAQDYSTNRQNALDKYNVNYGTQYADPYKFNYQGGMDQYNSQIHNYDLSKQYGWYSTLFDWQKDQDLFDRKFRLLGV